MLPSAVFTM